MLLQRGASKIDQGESNYFPCQTAIFDGQNVLHLDGDSGAQLNNRGNKNGELLLAEAGG